MTQVFHVRSWRKKMKWSRKEAAERLGLSVHTIKSYELHRRDLSKPIQRLMERLEEEQTALMTSGGLEQNDTPIGALIVSGAFGQGMATFLDTATAPQFLNEEHENPLMVFRPCLFDVSSELSELCRARGTEVGVLNANGQTSSPSTVDQLKHHLTQVGQRGPDVVFLSCTVPQTKLVFPTVYSCFKNHQTQPLIVSFYSFLDTEHEALEEITQVNSKRTELSGFGDYLFLEKRPRNNCDEDTKKNPHLKSMYAVLDASGNHAVSWSKDRELVVAQLLALLYPEENRETQRKWGGDACPEETTQHTFQDDKHSEPTRRHSFKEKNIYRTKKEPHSEKVEALPQKK